jgi:hypothetical protein
MREQGLANFVHSKNTILGIIWHKREGALHSWLERRVLRYGFQVFHSTIVEAQSEGAHVE